MADRPLQGLVEELWEFEGCSVLGYWTKGHVDQAEFVQEIQSEYERECLQQRVQYTYARYVPVGPEDPGLMLMYPGVERGRGAFPITYLDLDEYGRE